MSNPIYLDPKRVELINQLEDLALFDFVKAGEQELINCPDELLKLSLDAYTLELMSFPDPELENFLKTIIPEEDQDLPLGEWIQAHVLTISKDDCLNNDKTSYYLNFIDCWIRYSLTENNSQIDLFFDDLIKHIIESYPKGRKYLRFLFAYRVIFARFKKTAFALPCGPQEIENNQNLAVLKRKFFKEAKLLSLFLQGYLSAVSNSFGVVYGFLNFADQDIATNKWKASIQEKVHFPDFFTQHFCTVIEDLRHKHILYRDSYKIYVEILEFHKRVLGKILNTSRDDISFDIIYSKDFKKFFKDVKVLLTRLERSLPVLNKAVQNWRDIFFLYYNMDVFVNHGGIKEFAKSKLETLLTFDEFRKELWKALEDNAKNPEVISSFMRELSQKDLFERKIILLSRTEHHKLIVKLTYLTYSDVEWLSFTLDRVRALFLKVEEVSSQESSLKRASLKESENVKTDLIESLVLKERSLDVKEDNTSKEEVLSPTQLFSKEIKQLIDRFDLVKLVLQRDDPSNPKFLPNAEMQLKCCYVNFLKFSSELARAKAIEPKRFVLFAFEHIERLGLSLEQVLSQFSYLQIADTELLSEKPYVTHDLKLLLLLCNDESRPFSSKLIRTIRIANGIQLACRKTDHAEQMFEEGFDEIGKLLKNISQVNNNLSEEQFRELSHEIWSFQFDILEAIEELLSNLGNLENRVESLRGDFYASWDKFVYDLTVVTSGAESTFDDTSNLFDNIQNNINLLLTLDGSEKDQLNIILEHYLPRMQLYFENLDTFPLSELYLRMSGVLMLCQYSAELCLYYLTSYKKIDVNKALIDHHLDVLCHVLQLPVAKEIEKFVSEGKKIRGEMRYPFTHQKSEANALSAWALSSQFLSLSYEQREAGFYLNPDKQKVVDFTISKMKDHLEALDHLLRLICEKFLGN